VSSEFKKAVKNAKGKKAVVVVLALILLGLGCSELVAFIYPGIVHLRAVSAWPVHPGTMSESVLTSFTSPQDNQNPIYNAVDVFRVNDGDKEHFCHWDEPVGTEVYDRINERLKPEHWLWSRGTSVSLYVQPGGKLCEPVDGWTRAVSLTSFWVRLIIGFSFSGALVLWIWQRRIVVPTEPTSSTKSPPGA
jgi:hypothetical protein